MIPLIAAVILGVSALVFTALAALAFYEANENSAGLGSGYTLALGLGFLLGALLTGGFSYTCYALYVAKGGG